MDWSRTLSRKSREQKKDRSISSSFLLRTFEDHQLESLGDIAIIYRKIDRSLGYKTVKFKEYVNVSGITDAMDAFHYIGEITRWKKQCEKWSLDPDGIELLARDNAPIEQISRELRLPRDRIILHAQCCLTIWSVNTKRCGIGELHKIMRNMDPEYYDKNIQAR